MQRRLIRTRCGGSRATGNAGITRLVGLRFARRLGLAPFGSSDAAAGESIAPRPVGFVFLTRSAAPRRRPLRRTRKIPAVMPDARLRMVRGEDCLSSPNEPDALVGRSADFLWFAGASTRFSDRMSCQNAPRNEGSDAVSEL